ncbi:GTPase Era [Candidatus Roizmanbacteria bacterium CG2_30_33_16]|uniref:GTPase Era n=4 Tax=Candidatus Roizmaniibacteriota TaxID=1752723 RepID=A0A2M7LTE9_9BACT|nr:MAG: GTPase Era [Candidatus Roizmanbacteria bacterium CG2_30_33_16]PIX71357.1 MAG: GTPase Era [Candidatus Roizmanbacteria bacterium CG_4_10_14_3_um_filter_33_21]
MKFGKVLLIGRPNVGKSTFVNNLIGQKVAITSPKAQTTRFPIRALYEDEWGKIVFIDTPGIFNKAEDMLSKRINQKTMQAIREEVDVVLYMVDQSRRRDFEEAHVLGIVRKIDRPKILVLNKVDKGEGFLPQYKFMEEEFKDFFPISGINRQHVKPLLDKIFSLLPKMSLNKNQEDDLNSNYPLLNLDSKIFIAELIREKVFLMMGKEIPYRSTVIVEEITERNEKLTYIKAKILTTEDRYKKMLIGVGGRKIKEIGAYARKEIALATSKKIYLDLTVETDPHWQEVYYT